MHGSFICCSLGIFRPSSRNLSWYNTPLRRWKTRYYSQDATTIRVFNAGIHVAALSLASVAQNKIARTPLGTKRLLTGDTISERSPQHRVVVPHDGRIHHYPIYTYYLRVRLRVIHRRQLHLCRPLSDFDHAATYHDKSRSRLVGSPEVDGTTAHDVTFREITRGS